MKITILICILMYSSTVLAQNIKTNDIYLENYKLSKKRGNRLLIIGGSSVAAGTALLVIPSKNPYVKVFSLLTGFSFIGTGVIISTFSIPFYITARDNKRKAYRIEPLVNTQQVNYKPYTSIGLQLKF